MDNNSSREESSSASEGSDHYEEDEVVWAKIQGYPWWPAYIGDVEDDRQGARYKVYFFGDNSHSRLYSSKIRKFQEFFPDFAPQAKKNPRLKNALSIAQAQLTENHEDVSYFDLHSSERKRSENLSLPQKKSFQEGISDYQQANEIRNEQQPVKRKRGRPRKNNILPITIPQKLQTNDKIEVPELQLDKTSDKDPSPQKQPKEQNQVQHAENEQSQQQEEKSEEEESEVKVVPRKKIISKQLMRVKRLIGRSLYRQAFHILSNFKINQQNILDVLDLDVIPILEEKLSTRSMHKLKDRAKKALIDRYFNRNHHEHSLHQRSKHSIRGKVTRRLFSFLRKHNPTHSKNLALNLEQKIQKRSCEKQDYMESMIHLLNNANSDGFLQKQLQQEKLS